VAVPVRAVTRGVAWVRPGNFHVTLRFLGDIDEVRLGEIGSFLREAAAEVSVFDLVLRGLGAFPTLARPRVIWAGVRGEGLAALAEAVEHGLEQAGVPRETRGFSGHVTLGRVRTERSAISSGLGSAAAAVLALSQALGRTAEVDIGRTQVERIVLMRSQLSPRGASYAELMAAPLAPLSRSVQRP
jgi:2'-5' RNA ligase